MSWEKPVYSTMVSAVGYDDENEELIITWAKSGKRSAYKGVSEDKAIELSNAPSVGQMVNMEIKNQYPHRYI